MALVQEVIDKVDAERHIDMLEERRAELLAELGDIQESMGEKLEDLFEDTKDFVDNKIKANIKLILIGVGIFWVGVAIGSLSTLL
jgi:hypothetical protein